MKRGARLLALLGAAVVGWLLLGARPHDVVLVYDLRAAPDASGLNVQIRKGAALVRDAAFPHPEPQIRHGVRLTDGEYSVRWTIDRGGSQLKGERTLTIAGEETIVLPLGP